MDDIRPNKKQTTSQPTPRSSMDREKEAAFHETFVKDVAEENATKKRQAAFRQFDRPRSKKLVLVSVATVIGVVVIIGVVGKMRTADNTSPQSDTVQSHTEHSDNAEDTVFDPTKFYGISHQDGTLYFALIVTTTRNEYVLENVFYQEQEEPEDTDNIQEPPEENQPFTLVKLGTEAYGPSDRLVISRNHVKHVFPLDEDSPILLAIRGYAAE